MLVDDESSNETGISDERPKHSKKGSRRKKESYDELSSDDDESEVFEKYKSSEEDNKSGVNGDNVGNDAQTDSSADNEPIIGFNLQDMPSTSKATVSNVLTFRFLDATWLSTVSLERYGNKSNTSLRSFGLNSLQKMGS